MTTDGGERKYPNARYAIEWIDAPEGEERRWYTGGVYGGGPWDLRPHLFADREKAEQTARSLAKAERVLNPARVGLLRRNRRIRLHTVVCRSVASVEVEPVPEPEPAPEPEASWWLRPRTPDRAYSTNRWVFSNFDREE